MSDPILKQAMSEIMDIIKKHDIAGHVILVSKTHSEFRVKVDPSWSCAKIEEHEDSETIHFQITKELEPEEDKRREIAESTAHIFFQIRDLAGASFEVCQNLIKRISSVMKIEHTPFHEYEPHKDN